MCGCKGSVWPEGVREEDHLSNAYSCIECCKGVWDIEEIFSYNYTKVRNVVK